MGKLNEHRVKVKSQVQIQLARLEKGMIVKARYNPKDGDVRRGAQEYMLLILNPIWQKKVHALSLDAFSNVRLNQLAEDVGLVYIPQFKKKRKVNIPKLEMRTSSQRFYASFLRKDMSTKWGNSYRTFDIKHFNKLFLVDYKFNDSVENKFLLEDRDGKTDAEKLKIDLNKESKKL